MQQNQQQKSVIIIGAGPNGILNLKYLSNQPKITVQCFEYKNDVGGNWNYVSEEEQKKAEQSNDIYYQNYKSLNSAVYEDLVMDIPKQLMTFKGFPMDQDWPDNITSTQFQQYLQQYCKKHDLYKSIKFETYVESVRLVKNLTQEEKSKIQDFEKLHSNKKWLVQTKNKNQTEKINNTFADYVICANGHFSTPNTPVDIKGQNLEQWQQKCLHSHSFRRNHLKNFANKNIIIYGTMPSGQDLLQLSLQQTQDQQPKKIYFMGRDAMTTAMQTASDYKQFFDNGKLEVLKGSVLELEDNGKNVKVEILENEEKQIKTLENVDNIIWCTGYKYTYPFFKESDKIIEFYNKDNRQNAFGPLFKSLVSINEPTLFFPGLLNGVLATQTCFERQAIIIKDLITEKIKMPSKEEMEKDYKSHYDFCKQFVTLLFKAYIPGSKIMGHTYLRDLGDFGGYIENKQYDQEFDDMANNILTPLLLQNIFSMNYISQKSLKISGKIVEKNYCPLEDKF